MDATTYATFAEALRRDGAEVSLAEAHGLLCGLLCADPDSAAERWLEQLYTESEPGAARAALDALRDLTADQLGGEQLDFAPLLPGDDAPLSERADTLGDWCQGFVYALGASGVGAGGAPLPGDAGELLEDLVQISRAGLDEDDDSEAEEGAYAELLEYVRVGVILIHEELQPEATAAVAADPGDSFDDTFDDAFDSAAGDDDDPPPGYPGHPGHRGEDRLH